MNATIFSTPLFYLFVLPLGIVRIWNVVGNDRRIARFEICFPMIVGIRHKVCVFLRIFGESNAVDFQAINVVFEFECLSLSGS